MLVKAEMTTELTFSHTIWEMIVNYNKSMLFFIVLKSPSVSGSAILRCCGKIQYRYRLKYRLLVLNGKHLLISILGSNCRLWLHSIGKNFNTP